MGIIEQMDLVMPLLLWGFAIGIIIALVAFILFMVISDYVSSLKYERKRNISISSRATGSVDKDGKVKLDTLNGYDTVTIVHEDVDGGKGYRIRKGPAAKTSGLVYLPYIMETRPEGTPPSSEYTKFMAQYKIDHMCCPDCGRESEYSITLVGYIFDADKPEAYRDRNGCKCKCGSRHEYHDRVKARPKVKDHIVIRKLLNSLKS